MRKILIPFILLIIHCSCGSKTNNDKNRNQLDRAKYVENPNEDDLMCISDIQRAKQDLAQGKIVFVQNFWFGSSNLRYEEELIQLCKDNGLEFDYEPISDIIFEDQTQGCYGDYMNNIIIKKYGIRFKDSLHQKADSLFLIRTQSDYKLVNYTDCDERPRLPNDNKQEYEYHFSIVVNDLNIKEKKGKYGGWPFYDLGFVVEKDSTISKFYSNNFVARNEENKIHEEKLFKIATEYIKKKYPIWIPGKIDSLSVRTDNNLRIFFINE